MTFLFAYLYLSGLVLIAALIVVAVHAVRFEWAWRQRRRAEVRRACEVALLEHAWRQS